MHRSKRRWVIPACALVVVAAVPLGIWVSLRHQPSFYRRIAAVPPERRRAAARHFVAQSIQLRNDIINEARWEAAFTDQEVNAWLAEDLVTHFADQIPPGVSDPRVAFEPDRATLAFRLDDGPIRSIVWVVAQIRVPESNQLALTVEKIRAGAIPVPADQILERIAEHARRYGVEVRWDRDGSLPVALIRYRPHLNRRDIVLEQLQVLNGRIHLSGRSEKRFGAEALRLPNRRVLQSTFPQRKIQRAERSGPPGVSFMRSSTWPAS